MKFVTWEAVREFFKGKTVAIVGSAPSCLECAPGFVDSHEIVVRINNHKCGSAQGFRTDCHYSFYGTSIRTNADDLRKQGVRLFMNKCPNAKPLSSDWHERKGKQTGIDFRWIYAMRRDYWFGDVYEPTVERFLEYFNLLDRHVPTTGFAAILEVLACDIRSAYITGFDFMTSGKHNVNERWRKGDPADPIGHRPELELSWLAQNFARYPLSFDRKLTDMIAQWRVASRVAATEAAA